jgi:hypothetical protein
MGSILETAYAILNHPDPSRSVPVRTEKLHLLIFLRYPEDHKTPAQEAKEAMTQ